MLFQSRIVSQRSSAASMDTGTDVARGLRSVADCGFPMVGVPAAVTTGTLSTDELRLTGFYLAGGAFDHCAFEEIRIDRGP